MNGMSLLSEVSSDQFGQFVDIMLEPLKRECYEHKVTALEDIVELSRRKDRPKQKHYQYCSLIALLASVALYFAARWRVLGWHTDIPPGSIQQKEKDSLENISLRSAALIYAASKNLSFSEMERIIRTLLDIDTLHSPQDKMALATTDKCGISPIQIAIPVLAVHVVSEYETYEKDQD